jgi:hypothetical protein
MIYNRETQHCSASKLKNFITSHLSDCPISAPHGTSTRLVDRPAKFVGNHLIAPKEDTEFYLRRMVDQTACINDEMLVDSCIKMSKCENVINYFYENINKKQFLEHNLFHWKHQDTPHFSKQWLYNRRTVCIRSRSYDKVVKNASCYIHPLSVPLLDHGLDNLLLSRDKPGDDQLLWNPTCAAQYESFQNGG